MNKISSLEFLEKGEIKVCFFKEKSQVIENTDGLSSDGEISYMNRYIKESGDRFYYRVRIKEKIEWYNQDLVKVPTQTQSKLESITNQIKNIVNEK